MDRALTDEIYFEFVGISAELIDIIEIQLEFSHEAKEKVQTQKA